MIMIMMGFFNVIVIVIVVIIITTTNISVVVVFLTLIFISYFTLYLEKSLLVSLAKPVRSLTHVFSRVLLSDVIDY